LRGPACAVEAGGTPTGTDVSDLGRARFVLFGELVGGTETLAWGDVPV
jgi:hypothetical protein